MRKEYTCAQLDRLSVSNPWKETTSTTEDKFRESEVHRIRSSLTQHSALSKRASTTEEIPSKALRACQSQPSSMMQYVQNSSSNLISLAEHLGTHISDHVSETPNKLSEDMIRCMCTIYCKLADPLLADPCLVSPTSSLSSMSDFSPKDQCDIWIPGLTKDSCFDVRLDNSPFFLIQAAYNIGGHVVSANVIQSSILGCRMSRQGQLRFLLSSSGKLKANDERPAYAIEHPEPLLHFALCLGNHSDPAVRVYTPKRVFQELEEAKDEYIGATFGMKKDQKLVLPKVVESFAKDSGLYPAGVMEMIQQSFPESFRRSIKKIQRGNSHKNIEWVPHNFAFRYLIMKELVK